MRQIAIVGTEISSRDLIPWDEDVDIWALNESPGNPNKWVRRCNGTFQLHSPEIYKSPHNRTDPLHWEWLKSEKDFPVYMQEVDPEVPGSTKYPLDEINKLFLSNLRWNDGEVIQFYTSTISYMIALAVYKGYEKIRLYGIEMSSSTEYQYQRDNVAFWAGVASQYAIVEMNCAQGIFDQLKYGYDGEVTYSLDKIEKELDYLKKQARDAEALRKEPIEAETWMDAHSILTDRTIDAGYATGMLAEAQRYLMREEVSRQEFEQNSAWGRERSKEYLGLMNFQAGKIAVYQEIESDKLKEAVEKQLERAYSAGMEKGKSWFNQAHMLEMDLLIRSAGGQKAVDYTRGE